MTRVVRIEPQGGLDELQPCLRSAREDHRQPHRNLGLGVVRIECDSARRFGKGFFVLAVVQVDLRRGDICH